MAQNIYVGTRVTTEEVMAATTGSGRPVLKQDVLDRAYKNREYLKALAHTKVIYGINTGFGPMADTYISSQQQDALQYNLIRSHATGAGKRVDVDIVRAAMLVRLHTLALGHSGVSPEILTTFVSLIEHDIIPVVYEHGSVGASGDLVQLAHIALTLIGEGEAFVNGTCMPAVEALQRHQIPKVVLSGRDGLALINGTAMMTAIGAVNVATAHNLVHLCTITTALLMQIVQSHGESVSQEVGAARPHAGQVAVAKKLRDLLEGSLLVPTSLAQDVPDITTDTVILDKMPQDIYSVRCVPQILGPILDTLTHATGVINTELQSVTDNPIIKTNEGVFHGGNFHGDYVAAEMDKVKMSVTKLSLLLERQINLLVNPKVNNELLPPFVNAGTPGIDLGLQGLQFVATSTTAESQTLATPMSVHSIPTNNDNQDIVSMGTNAALLTQRVIENTYQVMAIYIITVLQAIDVLHLSDKLSHQTHDVYRELREVCKFVDKDRVLSQDVQVLTKYIQKRDWAV